MEKVLVQKEKIEGRKGGVGQVGCVFKIFRRSKKAVGLEYPSEIPRIMAPTLHYGML